MKSCHGGDWVRLGLLRQGKVMAALFARKGGESTNQAFRPCESGMAGGSNLPWRSVSSRSILSTSLLKTGSRAVYQGWHSEICHCSGLELVFKLSRGRIAIVSMSISDTYNAVSRKDFKRLRMKNAVPMVIAFWIAAAVGAAGAPLKYTDVGADPARLLHIDFDAMREAYVGKYFLYQLDKPEMHSNMVAFQSIFGFDLRGQLHGMTIYTAGSTPNDSVVITYADFEPARLVKLMTGGEADFAITNNQHVIYSWIDKNKNSSNPVGVRKYAAILEGRMIAGNARQTVIDALAVVDGGAPSFSPQKAAKEFDTPGATNFVLASAQNLEFLASDSKVALLKLSKRVKLKAGESNEMLKATLTVDAGDGQMAQQMSLVAQGLITALALQKENPWAAKLVGGMTVQLEATGFRVDFSVPSEEVMAALKAYNQKPISTKPAGQQHP
jgi:hypothetical protein